MNSSHQAHRGLKGCAQDFPILAANPELVFLDTAASSQKPREVIQALSDFYTNDYANVHRGSYELSQRATSKYEASRKVIANFLGVKDESCVVFTKGTTDGVNLVAQALYETSKYKPRSAIMVTRSEHHANFVPWQQLAKKAMVPFVISELSSDMRELDLNDFKNKIKTHKPSIVALSSASNVLGNNHPWREMAEIAKSVGAMVFLDFAQSVAHEAIQLDKDHGLIDFAVFSSHKVFGPTGIGVLWSHKKILNELEPTHFGGDMISMVSDHESTWNSLPWKWEPGTPPIAEAIGFGAAINYISTKFSFEEILAHEHRLCSLALSEFEKIQGMRIYGVLDAKKRAPLITFNLEGVHSLDLATFLDQRHLALRSGHHCAQPLHRALGIESSIRASFSVYNDVEDVHVLIDALKDAKAFFDRLSSKQRSSP